MCGAKKVYLRPIEAVYNAIVDMMELQHGEEILSDPLYKKLYYKITLYGCTTELRFNVLEMDWNRCVVMLEINADGDGGSEGGAIGDNTGGRNGGEGGSIGDHTACIDDFNYPDNITSREFKLLDSMLPDTAPCGEAEDSRKYHQPKDMVLSAIHDLAALQKAKTLSSDSAHGVVRLMISMYEGMWEYRFTVEDSGRGRSCVTISLAGEETPDAKRLVDNEFALLDYVLLDRARIELAEIEEWDAKMLPVS